VRGDGYFWAVELVKDKATRAPFDTADRERLVRGFLPARCSRTACTAVPDDRGDVVIQVAPPLICGPAEFDEMEQILRHTLLDAQRLI
jgi:4-aminobutyrate aminotransferase-like enzyme